MLFIRDDEAQIGKRKKDRGTRTQNDLDLAGADLVPGLQPFVLTEFAMINAHVTAEMPLQPPDDLGRQRDLRQQVERLPALTDRCFDLPDIDLGLPAGRYSVEQANRSFLTNCTSIAL